MIDKSIIFNQKRHYLGACTIGIFTGAVAFFILYYSAEFLEELIGRTWALGILAFPSFILSFSPLIGYEWYMKRAKHQHCTRYGHNFTGKEETKWCSVCDACNMSLEQRMEIYKQTKTN